MLLHWIMTLPAMQGEPSDEHAIFVALWLKRRFRHIITTNWDFLLEHQLETLYDAAYLDPFEPAELNLTDGSSCLIAPDELFYLDPLGGDDFAWNPRWDMVVNDRDLVELERWGRPVWKIHGSPFFLSCPLCRGVNRWKRSSDLLVGEACLENPAVTLQPEIIFWGHGIDTAYPKVWQTLKRRLSRCDLILVSGFSGSDTYLKSFLERRADTWLVNPSPGEWDVDKISFIQGTSTDLTRELLPLL
jgi:NAD-dependent SIR2 family protein deacetylase